MIGIVFHRVLHCNVLQPSTFHNFEYKLPEADHIMVCAIAVSILGHETGGRFD